MRRKRVAVATVIFGLSCLAGQPALLGQGDANLLAEANARIERYRKGVERFYTILFSHPAVEANSSWDLSDQGAWQGAPAGLLRKDMSPKPAYDALLRLINDKWWTRAEVKAGRGGEARLRRFYGDYKVVVKQGGREVAGTFSFDKSTSAPIEVQLR